MLNYLFFVVSADNIIVTLSVSCLRFVNQCHHVFTERRITGGEEAQRKQADGEILAERRLTVSVKIAAVTAVIETAGMTVNTKAHPEILTMVSRA